MIPSYISDALTARAENLIKNHTDLFLHEQGILQVLIVLAIVFISFLITKTFFVPSDENEIDDPVIAQKRHAETHFWFSLTSLVFLLFLKQDAIKYGGYIQNDLFVLDAGVILTVWLVSSICGFVPGKLNPLRIAGIVMIWTYGFIGLFVGPDNLLAKIQDNLGTDVTLSDVFYFLLTAIGFLITYKIWQNRAFINALIISIFNKNVERAGLIANLFDRLIVHQVTIPDRINRKIASYQNKSESYIALFQFLLIGLFLVVYITLFSGFQDLIIPGVLVLYAFFVGHRLYLAEIGRLPHRMIILSIITDFSILVAYIWSLHIQYDGAPLLYLKGQGLLYMFILMALRTLSFQPIYVLVSGLCASVGWGLLLLYAIYFHPYETTIFADNFIGSLSDKHIYMRHEFMGIGVILVTMAILMLSQAMGRKVLVESLQAQGNISDLSHFFDSNVVKKIISRKQDMIADLAETKHATVMFIDLRNFTNSSSNKAPKHVIETLKNYQAFVVPIIEKHNGSIDKFMGDGILASFGAFDEGKTYARDALRAADDIMIAHKEWIKKPAIAKSGQVNEIGIGMATGNVIVGVIGNQNRYEYTVIGDAVNTASKLEKQTKLEHAVLLCDEDTYSCAKEQGYRVTMERLNDVKVEGMERKINLRAVKS